MNRLRPLRRRLHWKVEENVRGKVRLQAHFNARTRIEIVAQRVANEIERQYGEHHRQRGKQYKVRGVEQMSPPIVEHRSPTRRGRRNPKAEKTHGGFGEDSPGHADRSLHDDRLNNVRQNVPDDDAQVAGAKGAGGLNEFAFTRGEDLPADESGVADPSAERERENEIENAGAAKGNKRDGEQNSRKRQECIHQHDVDEAIDAAAIVTGDRADNKPEA